MREFCLTEEVLQRFVDGELSKEQTERTAAHLAACDECAQLLGEVEQENSLLMEAFAPEMSLPVPTLRLRERLDEAIAELAPRPNLSNESASSRLRAWFGSLFGSFSFTPQQTLGFASLAVVLAFASIFAVIQLRQPKDASERIAITTENQLKAQPTSEPVVNGGNEPAIAQDSSSTPITTNGSYSPGKQSTVAKRSGKASVAPKAPGTAQPAGVEPKLLPGEEGYLQAIASLTTAIEANKNDVLKPTVRADYERNLAVVDQAIVTTRQQAKRNPNDRDAVEFMYTAYQNKIELLSAVADQTRLASR